MSEQLIQPKITVTIPGLDQTIQKVVFVEGVQWGVIVGLVVGAVLARIWGQFGAK